MNLPQPSPEALEQSGHLVARLHSLIEDQGGWISFATYMAEALYAPALGYYSGGARKFGAGGDFITAPELTPLFGQAIATQIQQIMELSAPHIIEAGAGTGLLAADLLLELELRGALPESYAILEVSGELRERQFDTLAAKVPHLAPRVRWLDSLPERFSGALLANEVLDVMPVHIVAWRADGIFERGVALGESGQFVWADRPVSGKVAEAAEALARPLPSEGEYVSELNLAGRAWIAELAKRLDKGAMLLVDYGYPRAEYYLDSRSTGTLLCYFRHHAHGDPFRGRGSMTSRPSLISPPSPKQASKRASTCSVTPTRPTCCSTAACWPVWPAGHRKRAPTTSAPPRRYNVSPAPTKWASSSKSSQWVAASNSC